MADELPRDYRTAGAGRISLSQTTRSVIRDARRIQYFLSEIAEEETEFLPRLNIGQASLKDSPGDAARTERARLGVTFETQGSWELSNSFEEWRQRVHNLGVAVLLERMPWNDCRGLSLWDDHSVPVVVVNSEDRVAARSFTLFHEYGHLVLRKAGVCLAEPSQTLKGQIERWCNAFSASLLVPAGDLTRLIDQTYVGMSDIDWEMKHVQRLSAKFRVSRYVLARRLKELEITNFYDRHIAELRRFDKRPDRKKTASGGVRPEVKRLSEVGTGVALVVLDAWKGRMVDAGEIADVLGLKSDQLAGFEEGAAARRRRRTA
ncbi:MAG: ImmA/IrrE family metallo-endopeptidase [Dehalococcoidia bacterium]